MICVMILFVWQPVGWISLAYKHSNKHTKSQNRNNKEKNKNYNNNKK